MRRKIKRENGLTLVEVLVASSIFAFCLSGLLLTYMNLFVLTDMSRDSTIANNALEAKLEEARTESFADLPGWCDSSSNFDVVNRDFSAGGSAIVMGKGNVTCGDVVDTFTNSTYPDLKKIRVVISFKSRNAVIGEDQNLNGQKDAGEHQAGYPDDGLLHSPVEGVILIKNFTNSTS